MATALERAAQAVSVVDVSDEREETLSRQLQHYRTLTAEILPIERGALQNVQDKSVQTLAELDSLRFAREIGLPRFDPTPLSWRSSKNLPVLMIFSVLSKHVQIVADRGWWNVYPEQMIVLVQMHYPDVIDQLRKRANRKRVTLTAEFPGVIPSETREKIKKWPLEDIYLITETPKWEYNEISYPRVDPLVMLYRHDSFWLIDKFDTTTVEEYVAREFTS